jgi:hypothetical protein
MQLLKLSEATAARRRILVYLVDDTDGKTAKGGITISAGDVKISKNGAAEGNHAGTLTELAGGLYYYEFTSGELDTIGFLSFRLVKATVRTFVAAMQVVSLDPYDSVRAGLTALPNAAAGANGGLGTVDANNAGKVQSGTAANQIDLSSGQVRIQAIDSPVLHSGTAQAGGASTITLAAGASATNDYYRKKVLKIYGGTGIGQARTIIGYVGSSKVATMDRAWATNPDATSTYAVIASDFPQLDDGTQVYDPTTDSLQAIRDASATVQNMVDGVWNETRSGHATSGTFGQGAASVQGNVTGSVASMAAGGIASNSFAAGAINAAAISADAKVRLAKNVGLNNFTFLMVDSSDHVTAKTGLTVTAQRSIDGGALASCANAVVEVSNGLYKINLAASDLNGDVIVLRFTATGADARLFTIVTQTA